MPPTKTDPLARFECDGFRFADRDYHDRHVVYGTPDRPDFVILGVNEIRRYGAGSIQVDRRFRAMLEHLIHESPAARHW